MKKQSESELQSQCIDYLLFKEAQGLLWFTRLNVMPAVIHTGRGMIFRRMGKGAKKGIADLVVMIKGKTIWIELKSQVGKLSPFQKVFQKSVEFHSGGKYEVFKDYPSFRSYIDGILYNSK